MLSPYLCFMQIIALQPYSAHSQLSLKGSIVNIEVDINDMIHTLPRKFNDLSVIQIKLKRNLEHKSNYIYETIRPTIICQALKYLLNTPLYIENKIQIDQSFFTRYENAFDMKINFIPDSTDDKDVPNNIDVSQMFVQSNGVVPKQNVHVVDPNVHDNTVPFIADSIEPVENLHDSDEVLIVDYNKQIVSNIKIIAPGQHKTPTSWHEILNFDELCFPSIYGGHQYDKSNILSYAQRVKSEIRRSDRRSCILRRLLFMAKKKLENSVISSMYTCLRKISNNKKITCKNMKDSNFIDDMIRHDEG